MRPGTVVSFNIIIIIILKGIKLQGFSKNTAVNASHSQSSIPKVKHIFFLLRNILQQTTKTYEQDQHKWCWCDHIGHITTIFTIASAVLKEYVVGACSHQAKPLVSLDAHFTDVCTVSEVSPFSIY